MFKIRLQHRMQNSCIFALVKNASTGQAKSLERGRKRRVRLGRGAEFSLTRLFCSLLDHQHSIAEEQNFILLFSLLDLPQVALQSGCAENQ